METDKDKEYSEKVSSFMFRNPMAFNNTKTDFNELPVKFEYKGNAKMGNAVLWCKFLNGDWFKPTGGFDKSQILLMIDMCYNDTQIVSLMDMLSGGVTE